MTDAIIRTAQVSLAILAAALLMTVGIGSEASAKAGRRHWHARGAASGSHGQMSGKRVQLGLLRPVRFGPMRYYGGPKSPMWRGPVEN
ncbi:MULTISPECIES: hypothetical protein [Bradyrhizobium]|jgi:hypothetical protein|uniref:Uncharacterized protein n=2 Tax=Bradyrhizobium TaxID=374 RepID=A0ABY0PFC0_9BRAD|nr:MULTISPECIES: hypothetical protein [Bradyrhizobium]SDI26387.1 hypothetical protein SAMN05444163_2335 [Bradyrhizobium ottawaense]SED69173.1 hypothetical protein SAMN05444171_4832 [Bradyrhizobium lablabi]SHL65840.1 hypothetical protein SAMN05444321_3648 [Bradyrhizobium lablabi]